MKWVCFLLPKNTKSPRNQGLLCWGNATSLLRKAQHLCEAHHLRQRRNIVHLCRLMRNDVLALLEMMLTFGQMMLCPADTNEKILKAKFSGFFAVTVRTSRIVVCSRLDAPLTLGSAHSLLCGEKLRRKRYSIVFVSFSDSNRRASSTLQVAKLSPPTQKGHLSVSFALCCAS